MTGREGAATEALVDWTGPHATSFVARLGVERGDVTGVVGQFREAAYAWAAAWKDAIDEQNRILHAAAVGVQQGPPGHVRPPRRRRAAPRPGAASVADGTGLPADRLVREVLLMVAVSASPDRLATFAAVWRARAAAVDEQAALNGLASSVVAGCPGRAVDVPALGALTTVLDNMATNESFVATVHAAVVGADLYVGGVATIDGAVVDAALDRAGLADGPPVPVEFDPATREVVAPTSGMDRRPDQRVEREHDPPRARRRVPGDRRRVEHRADVELAARNDAGRVRCRLVLGARLLPRGGRRPGGRLAGRRQRRRLRAVGRRLGRAGRAAAAPDAATTRTSRCRPTPSGASCSIATVR